MLKIAKREQIIRELVNDWIHLYIVSSMLGITGVWELPADLEDRMNFLLKAYNNQKRGTSVSSYNIEEYIKEFMLLDLRDIIEEKYQNLIKYIESDLDLKIVKY